MLIWPNAKRLELDPPSDYSIDVSQRAEFNGLLDRVGPRRVFVFGVFRPQSADRPKKSPHFSTSNTTTAHTQMDLPFVGVQGHQKTLENPKTLMKIDVFVCLVVREPGGAGQLGDQASHFPWIKHPGRPLSQNTGPQAPPAPPRDPQGRRKPKHPPRPCWAATHHPLCPTAAGTGHGNELDVAMWGRPRANGPAPEPPISPAGPPGVTGGAGVGWVAALWPPRCSALAFGGLPPALLRPFCCC